MRSRYIHGLHELGGQHLMTDKPGWIVFTHDIGHDPADMAGCDYRPWADRGFGIIARLNHGYGKAGTIPAPAYYDAFAWRMANFVQASQGCETWVVANEPNHSQERPDGQMINAAQYAACFRLCHTRIHALVRHANDEVCMAAISPWNAESGDWLLYFEEALLAARPDAITLHTYTHGADPAMVTDEIMMGAPYQSRHYNFRAYRDFLVRVPVGMRGLPVYVTETDQYYPWVDVNRGWVQAAYAEMDAWNALPTTQKINALVLYRWPKYDQWYIEGKAGIHADFQAAVAHGYPSRLAQPEISRTWTEAEIRAVVRDEMRR